MSLLTHMDPCRVPLVASSTSARTVLVAACADALVRRQAFARHQSVRAMQSHWIREVPGRGTMLTG